MKSIIIDLDGTLANVDHRTHFVRQDSPQWDEFYSACDKDIPNPWCVILMNSFVSKGFPVLIVSARRDTEKVKTLKWLSDYGIPYDQLVMLRKGNENTADTVLKKRWLDGFGRDNIIFVVDDRQKVVDMWREEGVVCLQCYSWPEHEKRSTPPPA